MPEEQARQAGPHGLGRLDREGLLPEGEDDAPHQTDDAWRLGDHESDDDVPDTGLGEGHERDRQEQVWQGHDPVHRPHDDIVQPPDEPAHQTDGEPDDRGDRRHHEADDKRDAGAVDHPAVGVAPVHVGPEPAARSPGAFEALHGVHVHRIDRPKDGGQEGQRRNEAEQGGPRRPGWGCAG